ncbi:MAG: AAA family ATPase, partial [Thermoplasmata archaeon]
MLKFDNMGIIEKYIGSSVFRDRKVLSFDYIPKRLPHRDEQLKKLVMAFKPVVSEGIPQNVFLYGNVGTGKTVTAKVFCNEIQEYAKKGDSSKECQECCGLEFVFVNCRKNSTDQAVLLQIVRHFQPHFPDRGFSNAEMLDVLKKDLEKHKCNFIIVLDEINVLLGRSKTDIIYALTRFNEDSKHGHGNISLILISPKSVYEMLDAASRSTLKHHQIDFKPYKANELYDILSDRVKDAFFEGTVPSEILELISEIAAENNGDARFAIELLERAGMQADFEGSEVLRPEYVRAAKAEFHSTVSETKLEELDKQKLAVLLACSRALKTKTSTITGEVEKEYQGVCEEFGLEKRG